MRIREVVPEDAERLIHCIKEVENSNFMLFGPGERTTSPDQQRAHIISVTSEPTSTMLCVEESEKLVGYLFAIGGNPSRKRHSVYIVVGIMEEFRGKGIGTRLFQELENWAMSNGITRLELTVIEHNTAAVDLYKKMGFEVEGIKKNSLFINGKYVNEYYMAKLINS